MKHDSVALFPGSFDPFTNGHFDLTTRGAMLFDRVVVAVAHNPAKRSLFTPEERVDMIRDSVKRLKNVTVMHFAGLVVDCARQVGAQTIIRGLRAVSDFEFEFQMALMNRRLARGIEVAFLMPSQQYTYLNSTLVKEILRLGGPIRGLVPHTVEQRLRERLRAAPAGRPAKTAPGTAPGGGRAALPAKRSGR